MNEKLLEKLKLKDNYSKNQYKRIEHLAKYIRKKGFSKCYEKNVINLITYYEYIKSIDTNGYSKNYVKSFSSYINRHYDETKTKLYFDGNISEEEFLEEFICFRKNEEENKKESKKKVKFFKLVKRPLAIKSRTTKVGEKSRLAYKKTKEKVNNLYENTQSFLEDFYYKIPCVSRKKALDSWWNEYLGNLEEARQNGPDLFNEFKDAEEKDTTKTMK